MALDKVEFFVKVLLRWVLYALLVLGLCVLIALLFIDGESGYKALSWVMWVGGAMSIIPAVLVTQKEAKKDRQCRRLRHAEEMGLAEQVCDRDYKEWKKNQKNQSAEEKDAYV